MDRFGPQVGAHEHTIFGLIRDPVDLRFVSVAESDALMNFRLMARFSDGAVAELSLVPKAADQEPNALWDRVLARIQDLPPEAGRNFLEVGGRGEASGIVRTLLGSEWQYRAMDIHPGPNVDLVGDAHHLSELLPAQSVDVVYSSNVMEHFLAPWRFVVEANHVLRVGGLFMAMVPTTWSLHAEPWDFWRMTGHGWPALLNPGTGFQLLESAVLNRSSIVPQLPNLSGRTRAQYDPAYEHTFAIARKVSESRAFWGAYNVAWVAGRYER
jgi:SAM-dependent methyltransferase